MTVTAAAPGGAAGKPLYARLLQHRVFHPGAFLSLGLGLAVAELVLVLGYPALLGPRSSAGGVAGQGLSQMAAFLSCFALALGLSLVGGYLAAAQSRSFSTPEAAVALVVFGMPLPAVLTAMERNVTLATHLSVRLAEVAELARLLGDNVSALGYWLVFGGLVLALYFGIALGYVAHASGRRDTGFSYELFISTRYLSAFRPRQLAAVLVVLLLGVLPPLLVYAVVSAFRERFARARLVRVGLKDPLEAARLLAQLKQREARPTALMTAISVGSVGVGVMALIVVLSVMSGFEETFEKAILGNNSHGIVRTYDEALVDYPEVMRQVGEVEGVVAQSPFILTEVMVMSNGNVAGSMLKGLDPSLAERVTEFKKNMLPGGQLDWLSAPEKITRRRLAPFGESVPELTPSVVRDPLIALPSGPQTNILPGIVVGKELAQSLRVSVGDQMNVVSPLGTDLTPNGPVPRSRSFKVAGIFSSGMYEFDSKLVIIHLEEARKFLGMKGVMGLELRLADVSNARRIMQRIHSALGGYPYITKDWGEMNKPLLSALRLEKLVMAIILSIIVVIATGLIAATVSMLVLEKRKDIAVLKALGVSNGGVVKIFLTAGLQLGVVGSALGLAAGLAWCLFIDRVGIQLDPSVYYIPALPVRIEAGQTLATLGVGFVVSFFASIYPALKSAQVEPVEGLKAE